MGRWIQVRRPAQDGGPARAVQESIGPPHLYFNWNTYENWSDSLELRLLSAAIIRGRSSRSWKGSLGLMDETVIESFARIAHSARRAWQAIAAAIRSATEAAERWTATIRSHLARIRAAIAKVAAGRVHAVESIFQSVASLKFTKLVAVMSSTSDMIARRVWDALISRIDFFVDVVVRTLAQTALTICEATTRFWYRLRSVIRSIVDRLVAALCETISNWLESICLRLADRGWFLAADAPASICLPDRHSEQRSLDEMQEEFHELNLGSTAEMVGALDRDRESEVTDSIDAYQSGKYRMALRNLIPTIDGLGQDVFDGLCMFDIRDRRKIVRRLTSRKGNPMLRALATLMNADIPFWADRTPNGPHGSVLRRNPVAHGSSDDRYHRKMCLQAFSFLRFYCQALNANPRTR